MKIQLLIPAAGTGSRLGHAIPKALIPLGGAPLLVRTLQRFGPLGLSLDAVVTVPQGMEADFRNVLDGAFPGHRIRLAPGGAERQQSVENGLDRLDDDTAIVAIHDAARPFVPIDAVRAAIDAAAQCGAATVAIPAADTVLIADDEHYLEDTPDRRRVWACQTPQVFRTEVIRESHRIARSMGLEATDDATLVQRTGGRAKLVMGSPLNFKITTPADLAMAEAVLEKGLA